MADTTLAPHAELGRSSTSPAVAFPWGTLATAVVTLSATSLSVALGCAQLALGQATIPFLLHNNVEPRIRTGFLILAAVALVFPLACVIPSLVRLGREAVPALSRISALVCPFLVFCEVPGLANHEVAGEEPLGYLVLLTATALVLERLLGASLPTISPVLGGRTSTRLSGRTRRRALNAFVVFMAAAYAGYTGYFSILQHHRFQTSGYDLGIYTSVLANLGAGHFFRSTILSPDISLLAHHAEFGALYLVPIYALFPRAETLLVIQSIAIGGAAIPLYLFAATQLPRPSAAVLAVAYLFFAPLHGPNFYDFHWMPMTLPVWFTLFYGLAKRRLSIIVLAVLIVLPMREETGLMLAVLGLYVLGSGYWPRVGLAFGAIGTIWFALMRVVVIPSYGNPGFDGIYAGLVAPGEQGFSSVVKTLLANPNYLWKTLATTAKLKYVLHMMGPLLLLPIRRPLLLGLMVPGSLFTLITTGYDPTVSIAFQYTTHWVPWLFLAVIVAFRGFATESEPIARRRAALFALLFAVFCHSNGFGAILQHGTFMGGFHRVPFSITSDERSHYAHFREVLAKVPGNAKIAVTDPQSPHLGAWVEVCTLRIANCDADYLLISGRDFGSEDRGHVRAALERSSYGLVTSLDQFYLFERDHVSEGTATALRALGLS